MVAYCPECGAQLPDADRCDACGARRGPDGVWHAHWAVELERQRANGRRRSERAGIVGTILRAFEGCAPGCVVTMLCPLVLLSGYLAGPWAGRATRNTGCR